MPRWSANTAPAAVLFDLDGTLLDTAPDMVAALNELCRLRAAPELPWETARAQVSNGTLGLLRVAFPGQDPAQQPELQQQFGELYSARLVSKTRLFPDMEALLTRLEQQRIHWGVVTNKPRRFTEPLLAALGLLERSACTVSGDTLPERKPHPRPILYALEQIATLPEHSIYVGDARRDIESGRAAGTATIAVRYGYIEHGQDPDDWNADFVVSTPDDLSRLILGHS
ncbi:MAG: HAD-IA family hydrolase [Gammaproteobacteria bacterium]